MIVTKDNVFRCSLLLIALFSSLTFWDEAEAQVFGGSKPVGGGYIDFADWEYVSHCYVGPSGITCPNGDLLSDSGCTITCVEPVYSFCRAAKYICFENESFKVPSECYCRTE